jgi:hypothetical protein
MMQTRPLGAAQLSAILPSKPLSDEMFVPVDPRRSVSSYLQVRIGRQTLELSL